MILNAKKMNIMILILLTVISIVRGKKCYMKNKEIKCVIHISCVLIENLLFILHTWTIFIVFVNIRMTYKLHINLRITYK